MLQEDHVKDDSGHRAVLCSWSQEYEVRMWWQQDSWIPNSPDSLAWRVKPTTQLPLARRCTRRKHQDYCDCQRKSARTCGKYYHPVEDGNNGTSIDEPVLFLERNLYGHPVAGLLWERELEESKKYFSSKTGTKCQRGSVCLSPKITTILVRMYGRRQEIRLERKRWDECGQEMWLKERTCGTNVAHFCKKKSTLKIRPFC